MGFIVQTYSPTGNHVFLNYCEFVANFNWLSLSSNHLQSKNKTFYKTPHPTFLMLEYNFYKDPPFNKLKISCFLALANLMKRSHNDNNTKQRSNVTIEYKDISSHKIFLET